MKKNDQFTNNKGNSKRPRNDNSCDVCINEIRMGNNGNRKVEDDDQMIAQELRYYQEYSIKRSINDYLIEKYITNFPLQVLKELLIEKADIHFLTLLDYINICNVIVEEATSYYKVKVNELKTDKLLDTKLIKITISQIHSIQSLSLINQVYKHILHESKNYDRWKDLKSIIEGYYKSTRKKQVSIYHPTLEKFLDESEVSEETKKVKRVHISRFIRYGSSLNEFGKFDSFPVRLVNSDLFNDYVLYLKRLVSKGTITPLVMRNELISLSTFFKYLNIDVFVKLPKVRDFFPRRLPNDLQVANFFKTVIIYSDNPKRDFLYFALMATMGLRSKEVFNIKRKDINLRKGKIIVKGKNKVIDELAVEDQVILPLLKDYIMELNVNSSNYIFSSKTGKKLLSWEMLKLFKLYAEIAGWEEIKGNHVWRHYFATTVATRMDSNLVKMAIRALSDRTVSRYIHTNFLALKESVKKLPQIEIGEE